MKKMNISISPVQLAVFFLALSAIYLFSPEALLASVGFGDIGENVAENAKGVAKGITMSGYALAIGMGVWGGVDMYKASKSQGQTTYASGLSKVIIGALLLGIGEFLGSGSTTLFGSDQTSGLDDLGI